MTAIATIARASFREAVRDRVLYTIVLFAVIIMASSHVVESLVISEKTKIVKDMGLGSISIFGLVIAVTVGANIFFKEIKRKRFYPLLSKPVSRAHVVIGKYLGSLLTLAVTMALMGAILLLDTASMEGVFDLYIAVGIGAIFMELALMTAYALFFSSVCAPVWSGVMTCAVYAAGHTFGLLRERLSSQSERESILNAFSILVPDLEKFNIKAEVVYHELPPWNHLAGTGLYCILLITLLVFLSWVVFRKKDME